MVEGGRKINCFKYFFEKDLYTFRYTLCHEVLLVEPHNV